ncbi:MAG: hypothetical protein V3R71_04775 [Gemmatimonadales bacterium]
MMPSLALLRVALLMILMLGVIGMGAELLLLGHTEDVWQWEPLAMFAVGLPVLMWHARMGTDWSRRFCLLVMAAFVVSGVIGLILHYRGNVEFELEMVPALTGIDLLQEAMTGATPVLAPGAMIMLGLLGLLYAFFRDGNDLPQDTSTTRGTDQ